MQIKTIKKTIVHKLECWLSSIDSPSLVIALKKDIIVTGGCITSLFLNENVNDYDVYIRTKETLNMLMDYYAKLTLSTTPNIRLQILDGSFKDRYIEEVEIDYKKNFNINSIDDINAAYAIAIRNLKPSQLKFYLGSVPRISLLTVGEIVPTNSYKVAYISPNAISLTDSLQIVVRFWGEPDVIHESYDFVHATNYFTFKDGLVTNNKALESILTKQLIYKGSLYPVTSIIRVRKFIKRSWNINAGEILKIVFQCSSLDLTNSDVLEEQLIGVDVAYFFALIEPLRNIGGSVISEASLFEIIDKMFNIDDINE